MTRGKTKRISAWCLNVILYLLIQNVNAQQPVIHAEFFGIEEGLSHRNVNCVHQDDRGVIWVGTEYGLNRFDGYNFKWFTVEKDGLPSNDIDVILQDKEGLFWLFNTEEVRHVISIGLFDPETYNVITLEEKFGNDLPFKPQDIVIFTANEKSELAFITNQQRLFTYDGEWKSYPVDIGPAIGYNQLVWAEYGGFYLVVEKEYRQYSIMMFDVHGGLIKTYEHPANYVYLYSWENPESVKYLISKFSDSGGNVDGFELDKMGNQHPDQKFKFQNFKPEFGFQGRGAKIKRTTGVNWYYDGWKQFSVIEDEDNSLPNILSEQYKLLERTNDIIVDSQQAVWVATSFGLYRFQIKDQYFENYLHNTEQGAGGVVSCRKITADINGDLWVRVESPGSIWKFNRELKTFDRFDNTSRGRKDLPVKEHLSFTLLNNKAQEIVYLSNLNIVRVNPTTLDYTTSPAGFMLRDVWGMHEDKYGRIWFHDRFYGEMTIVDGLDISTMEEKLDEQEPLYVYQYLERPDSDTILVVTSKGIYSIDIKEKQIIRHFWANGEGTEYFPYHNIHYIHEENGQKGESPSYWIATAENGVIHANITGNGIQILEHYTRADGLPNNTIYAIFEDDYNNLWMSSSYGIVQFNKTTKRFRGYTESDGISHNEFNRLSYFKDDDGRIYFGSLKGLTTFHPRDFVKDTSTLNLPLVITDFEYFDKKEEQLVSKPEILVRENKITIRPGDRFFKIEFALLAFEKKDKIQYAYKIEGVDKDWNYQRENTLRIGTLPYGSHQLTIKGQAANGVWSENELSISIVVLKPFYLQWWFWISALLVVFLSVIWFFRIRVKRFRQRQLELEAIVAERTRELVKDKITIEKQAEGLKSLEKQKSRFFANVSHELRTPLSLILGPVNSLLLRSTSEGNDSRLLNFIKRNAEQLQGLINEILDLSKLEEGKLEVIEEQVAFYPYLKKLLAQFHSASKSESLVFVLHYQLDESLVILLDKSKFEKIVNNFLSNAIKFTPPNGIITLVLVKKEDNMLVSVQDTGKGIHPDDLPHVFDRFFQSKQADMPEKGGAGIGLSLSKELAELMNGSVWAESELDKGSTFYLEMPLREVNEKNDIEPTEARQFIEVPSDNLSTAINEEVQDDDPGEFMEPVLENGIPGKPKVLIVEDNPDLREYLSFLLADYEVILAENGQVGWEQLNVEETAVDLVVSDLMMPVMDGFTLLNKIKAHDHLSNLPVVMLTSKANAHDKLKALRIGVDDYMLKPFSEEELLARLKNLLKNYRKRQDYFKEEQPQKIRPAISGEDQEWLSRLEAFVIKNISNSNLTADFVANEMSLSRRQLFRRLKMLTGLTPKQYMVEVRFNRARDLLEDKTYSTVKAVAYEVGFKQVKYFSKLFKAKYGKSPSEYL